MKDLLYETMDNFRKALNEMEDNQEDNQESVAYTNQDEILGQYMESARETFGANFSNTEKPMIYFPDGENVIFQGEIAKNLNNAKFQMSLNGDSAGCHIFLNDLELTKDNVELLRVINGFYENWKEQLSTMADKAPMSLKGNDNDVTNNNGSQSMVPGDDFGSKQQ